jgi:hypothetical protein
VGEPEAGPREHPGPGLREDAPPRRSVLGLASGVGAIWGLLGYSILWEGTPLVVDRPFVQSVAGTLVLLPVRWVLWGIHRAEQAAGRSFDLSRNHWWIALVAAGVGAGIAVAATAAVRGSVRRLRRTSGPGFDTDP